MDQSEVARLCASFGLSRCDAARRLRSGLGGTELWHLDGDHGPLVLRAFAPGTPAATVEREVLAHRFVRDHGIVAPRIVAHRSTGDRPCLLMEWIGGSTVAERLWADDSPAAELGRRCGELLARLHALDPGPLVAGPIGDRSWIAFAGDQLSRQLSERLVTFDRRRLLHLDFHPENMIITDDGRLCLLDWANVRLGPPAADLARTMSILELVSVAMPDLTQRQRRGVAQYRDELLTGYAAAGQDPEIPAPVEAWSYAVQLHDLAGSWVPESYFERLRTKINSIRADG